MSESVEKKPKKRAVKRPGELSAAAFAILERVVAGEALLGIRTFPHPFRYRISGAWDKDKNAHVGAGGVTQGIVSDLASRALIDAHGVSPLSDAVTYLPTNAGRQLVIDGPPAPDRSQLDWIAEAS